MKILVTGGAGYIGSHVVLELLNSDYEVVVVDNLINSHAESLKRVEHITGKKVDLREFDLSDEEKLRTLFKNDRFDSVIHFAGLKAVGESNDKPLLYYSNNLGSTLSLLRTMDQHDVRKLVFSSSATVYGVPTKVPLTETSPRSATNPYGQTKLIIEQILEDVSKAKQGWNITSLRYFNPIGAHPSALIGEDPNGPPNNLLPYISRVASGDLEKLSIFGDDYDTPDGTGLRDYIHVVDLAQAHLAALEHLDHQDVYKAYNIGTGKPTSVIELINAYEKVVGNPIAYIVSPRRPGDVASCYADPSLAAKELKWQAKLSVEDGCRSEWEWRTKNPHGYTRN